MTVAYPDSIYDQPRALLSALGGLWADIYERRDQILSLVEGKALIESQTVMDVLETTQALSRYEVPIYHRDNWYQLLLLASEQNDAQTQLPRYDDGIYYDDGYRYDIPREQPYFSHPLPADLRVVPIILNRFVSPSLTWVQSTDYIIDLARQAIVFKADPFADVRVAKRPVYADGEVVDTEASLWIYRGEFDWDRVYRQFGYVLGGRLRSSRGFRDLMNAVFDALVGGTAGLQILQAMSALTGIPLCQEATETVEQVTIDQQSRLIVTDQHVYRFAAETLPIVSVGDSVAKGSPLTDALQVFEFNRGQLDDTLLALAMGRGYLSTCYYGDLVFENKDVPLEVITDDPSGYTKIKFPLGGFPADVDHFFDELHARGVAAANQPVDECANQELLRIPGDGCDTEDIYYRVGTLAHLLDRRTVRDTEPQAANLPTTINPLLFLVQNVLRNNIYVVRIKAAGLMTGIPGMQHAGLLRKIVPPHTGMIILVELTAPTEYVTSSRIQEAVSQFQGMEPLEDTIGRARVREHTPVIRLLSGSCQ